MPATLSVASPVTRETTFSRANLLRLAAITPAVLLVHGYHPFADDAEIYVAGIRKLLNPALYQVDAPFVLANTHLSIFAHILAGVVRVTHLPLAAVLLATHLVSIYLFLLACGMLAARLFARTAERWFAVAFAAACFTLPAAGTGLVLMDPYVTARSFSTPLGLLALAAALDRRWKLAGLLILLTGLMHPLMVLFAGAIVLLYVMQDRYGTRATVLTGAVGAAAVGLVWLATRGTPVSAAYLEAMGNRGRSYYFLTRWKWYEDIGLVAPLALFAVAAYCSKIGGRVRKLCLACIVMGVSSSLAAFLFVHPTGPYLLVRIEILRSFHTLYLVGVIMLGAWLGRVFWYRREIRWVVFALLALAAGGLFTAQRAAYPFSAHIEWPGMGPRNPWAQAYWRVRQDTPVNAIFAADPQLIFRDGVDMQGFRATTGRSILADNKDQGVAAGVDTSTAEEWAAQRDAQIGVDTMTDQQRITKLKTFGVTWLLLKSSAVTSFPCPYQNAVAKVCRMN